MSNHQHLQARVMRFLVLYEGLVITACIAGGALLTFGQGGSLSAATPLALVAAAEMLRIPVAAFSTSVDRFGRVLAFIIMAAIAVISFDALALIFEQYIDNRAAAVLKAQRAYDLTLDELKIKKADVAKLQGGVDQAKAAVTAADAAIANTENNTPPQPAPSGLSCGKTRSTCPVDRKARDDFHKAQVAYLAALKQQRADRRDLVFKSNDALAALAAVSVQKEEAAATAARRELEDVKLLSPMHRLASAIVGVKTVALTEDQFEAVKSYGVVGLAGAFATISMLVSLLAHQPERGTADSKLSRAIRGYFYRKRKPIVRTVEKLVPSGERVVYRYIPVSNDDDSLLKRTGMRGESIRKFKEMFQ